MPKRVQDIIPNGKRSIRDIPINSERHNGHVSEKKSHKGEYSIPVHITTIEKEPISANRVSFTPPVIEKKKKGNFEKWFGITVLICLVMIIVGYFASTYFVRATVILTPRVINIEVDNTYTAGASNNLGLTYDVERAGVTINAKVIATSGPDISTKAQGSIRLYNNFSSTPQRLVAGTRLSAIDGKIYLLSSSVVIPGKTDTGPGSIDTNIVADQAGSAYNITGNQSLDDFKIVAYRGTPRYESMYGRILSPITGGYTGKKIVIEDSVMKEITASTSASLSLELTKIINNKVPSGYILFPTSCQYDQSIVDLEQISEKEASLNIKGEVVCPIFNIKELVRKIAGPTNVASFNSFGYYTEDLKELSVIMVNATTTSINENGTPISLKIKGKFKMIGDIDSSIIQKEIAGKTINGAKQYLSKYEAILINSEIRLMPPWINHIPNNLKSIRLKILENKPILATP